MAKFFGDKLVVEPRVAGCALSADDWCLADTKNRRRAAHALNNGIKRLVNQYGARLEDISKGMERVMHEYDEDGATEPEVYAVLDFVLSRIFPQR